MLKESLGKSYPLRLCNQEPGACKHSKTATPADLSKVGDLRRTLAKLTPHSGAVSGGNRRSTAGEVAPDCLHEEIEESDTGRQPFVTQIGLYHSVLSIKLIFLLG